MLERASILKQELSANETVKLAKVICNGKCEEGAMEKECSCSDFHCPHNPQVAMDDLFSDDSDWDDVTLLCGKKRQV